MLGESREAILTTRHVQFCQTPCTPIAPISALPIEPFVYLVSVLLDLGMSVSCSYHVITSSFLCYVATLLHPILPPDVDEVFDEASALLELEQLKKRVGELEKKLGAHKQQRKPHGLKFLVRNMSA